MRQIRNLDHGEPRLAGETTRLRRAHALRLHARQFVGVELRLLELLVIETAQAQDILGVKVARVVLPVAAGRNLAVLLEAAVRSTILKLRGIDSTQEFIDRQARALHTDETRRAD